MRFVCEDCGFEMDYDEDENEIVECDECYERMMADTTAEV